jgi:hypothetical protein
LESTHSPKNTTAHVHERKWSDQQSEIRYGIMLPKDQAYFLNKKFSQDGFCPYANIHPKTKDKCDANYVRTL